jgi:hypothetical protein
MAQIPFARIQAHGNSRITAFIHLAEVVPYFAVLIILIDVWGINGAAVAWTIRVTADYLALEFFSRRIGN